MSQLLRAVLRSICASLEAHADDATREVSWMRLLKLAPILRRFVLPEDATLGILEADASLCQSFVLDWLKAAETIVSLTSPAIQARQAILQLLTLYDVLSLVTGKIDIWITRQADLVDAVKVTLQLAENIRTPDLAEVRTLLVDMAFYLLTCEWSRLVDMSSRPIAHSACPVLKLPSAHRLACWQYDRSGQVHCLSCLAPFAPSVYFRNLRPWLSGRMGSSISGLPTPGSSQTMSTLLRRLHAMMCSRTARPSI